MIWIAFGYEYLRNRLPIFFLTYINGGVGHITNLNFFSIVYVNLVSLNFFFFITLVDQLKLIASQTTHKQDIDIKRWNLSRNYQLSSGILSIKMRVKFILLFCVIAFVATFVGSAPVFSNSNGTPPSGSSVMILKTVVPKSVVKSGKTSSAEKTSSKKGLWNNQDRNSIVIKWSVLILTPVSLIKYHFLLKKTFFFQIYT